MTTPLDAQIVGEYQAGESLRVVARRHHMHETTVVKLLADAGVPLRKVGAQPAPVSDEDLLQWRHEGYSLRAIAEMAEMSYTGVRRRITIAETGQ